MCQMLKVVEAGGGPWVFILFYILFKSSKCIKGRCKHCQWPISGTVNLEYGHGRS